MFVLCLLTALMLPALPIFAQDANSTSTQTSLIQLLQAKGVLSPADVASINQAGSAQASNIVLEKILLSKGLISQNDFNHLTGGTASPALAVQPPAQTPAKTAPASTGFATLQSPPHPTEPGAPAVVAMKPSRSVNEAIAPVRALPVGGVEINRLPAFKAGGVGLDPYGFIKATAVFDSSDPSGNDFPLPGFLVTEANTSAGASQSGIGGPNGDPEFHIKARSSRVGLNMSWYDSPKWDITGKIEMDFEGNFNRSDNRNVSTARSNNPSLRLAYARMDYHAGKNTTVSSVFGQDWTIFGSSTMPNILESTFFGAYYGFLYERDPQMRVGIAQKVGKFTIMPEFAINEPASGVPPPAADVYEELAYGEREGPDSGRPNYQARVVGQWQLDHAPGVAPAQIIVSGMDGARKSIALASAIPAAYSGTFSNGATGESKQDGWDYEFQLPTHLFTLIGKYYAGADLRWMFGGQAYSYFNDINGLTSVVTVNTEDGGTIKLGTNSAGQQIVAPERPVRAAGGVVQLGLPLSRLFNVNPASRNAGWSLYATYGIDQAKERDANRAAGNRHAGTVAAGTLNYKFDKWISFSFEQSLYTEHANPEQALPVYRGYPAREWNDVREEFGPVFAF